MLRVWVDGEAVGVLDRLGERGSTFAYGPSASPERAVSLTMPRRTASWDIRYGLPPVFDMNMPEGALRERLRRRFAKAVGSFDDFDLISVTGRSQIGRVRFSGMDEELNQAVPFQSVDEILRARRDGGLFDYLIEEFAVYSGLAGVQPKFMVRGVEGEGRESQSVKGATHIVKLWDENEYPELAANEYFCLLAARKAGLRVPPFSLSDDGAALVVERFDLEDGRYMGFEDFCVLNGVASDKKYLGGYETKLFRRIADFVSPGLRQAALEEAFRLFALSCAIRNGDAHLKNFGVTYRDAESPVALAPVFDLVTTRAYLPQDAMALTLSGSTSWPGRKALVALGQTRANLKPSKAAEILEETCDAVAEAAEGLADYFRDSRHPETGERMLAFWEEGVRSLSPDRTLVQTPGMPHP